MSNNAGFTVSIKEYAAQRGKTVQAVYQQMKRKENAAALEGHIIIQRVGNKDVKYLDEKAVSILDEGSLNTPIVYIQDDLKNELAATKLKLQEYEKALVKEQGKVELLREQLAQKDEKLLLLAAPEEKIGTLEAQNAVLSADKEKLEEKVAQADKTAQELSDKLSMMVKGSFRERRKLKKELKSLFR